MFVNLFYNNFHCNSCMTWLIEINKEILYRFYLEEKPCSTPFHLRNITKDNLQAEDLLPDSAGEY